MDGPVFDNMLKIALEEALRQDIMEAPEIPAPSPRQRRRMRRLLTAPASVCSAGAEMTHRPRIPGRWLAAAVIAALLTGAAATGLSLGNGAWFRQWFDESLWAADYYGGAADTEQLLGMGVEMASSTVESDGMRLEVFDAVFDGQRLMMFVRMTFLDPTLLEKTQRGSEWIGFDQVELLPEDGGEFPLSAGVRSLHSFSALPWTEEEPEEGTYPLLFQFDLGGLDEGGPAQLRMTNLILWPASGLAETWPGEWTLSMTLKPTKALYLKEKQACRVDGADWVLDGLSLSPLTLRMEAHCLSEQRKTPWYPFSDIAIHMKTGEIIDQQGCSATAGYGGRRITGRLDFALPLDLEQVDYVHLFGMDIYLEE